MANLTYKFKNCSENWYAFFKNILILAKLFRRCTFSNNTHPHVIKCLPQRSIFNLLPFFFAVYGTELKIDPAGGQQNEGPHQIVKILGYEFPFSLDSHLTTFEKMLYTFNYKHQLNLYLGEYFKIFVIFTIIFIMSLLLFIIAYFLSLNTMRDAEKLSQYECGFEPFDEATRHPFDVHFYVVGILFLIFDVEIALLFPWVFSLTFNKWLNFYTMLFFYLFLP